LDIEIRGLSGDVEYIRIVCRSCVRPELNPNHIPKKTNVYHKKLWRECATGAPIFSASWERGQKSLRCWVQFAGLSWTT